MPHPIQFIPLVPASQFKRLHNVLTLFIGVGFQDCLAGFSHVACGVSVGLDVRLVVNLGRVVDVGLVGVVRLVGGALGVGGVSLDLGVVEAGAGVAVGSVVA
jgi:hypothetical protein